MRPRVRGGQRENTVSASARQPIDSVLPKRSFSKVTTAWPASSSSTSSARASADWACRRPLMAAIRLAIEEDRYAAFVAEHKARLSMAEPA